MVGETRFTLLLCQERGLVMSRQLA
jgi:hypothetical protein